MGPSLLSLNNDFKEDPPPSREKNGELGKLRGIKRFKAQHIKA